MFNYLKLKEQHKSVSTNEIIQNNFENENIKIRFKDYYFQTLLLVHQKQ